MMASAPVNAGPLLDWVFHRNRSQDLAANTPTTSYYPGTTTTPTTSYYPGTTTTPTTSYYPGTTTTPTTTAYYPGTTAYRVPSPTGYPYPATTAAPQYPTTSTPPTTSYYRGAVPVPSTQANSSSGCWLTKGCCCLFGRRSKTVADTPGDLRCSCNRNSLHDRLLTEGMLRARMVSADGCSLRPSDRVSNRVSTCSRHDVQDIDNH